MVADVKKWLHFNPVEITAGNNVLTNIDFVLPKGNVLLLTSPGFTKRGHSERIVEKLRNRTVVVFDQIDPNPDIDRLDAVVRDLKGRSFGSIIAVGGGSVIDSAKILSVFLPLSNSQTLHDIFRLNATFRWGEKIHVCAVPSTSGTGAEVSPFATIWDKANFKKYSLAGTDLFPMQAILDPGITVSLPYNETLFTGLDAISHSLESLWNKNRTPISSCMALRSLELAHSSLPFVLKNPRNIEKRALMQQSALLAGLAISQTRTAIAHSISYPITSYFGVPHGLACSFTLPSIIRVVQKFKPACFCGNEMLMDNISEMLVNFKLMEKLQNFVTFDSVLQILNEMYAPSRADNFILKVSDETIKRILKDCSHGN